MRLPNGYGSISKLSGNRRKPFVVRTPSPESKIIGYVKNRAEGIEMLTDYRKNPYDVDMRNITLKELYERYKKTSVYLNTSKSVKRSLQTSFNKISHLYDVPYRNLKVAHMRQAVEEAGKPQSQAQTKNLFYHLDRYAKELEVTVNMNSNLITVETDTTKKGKVLSEEEIKTLWKMPENEFAKHYLILLYTGFRVGAYLDFTVDNVNLEENYIKGGIKTQAGKDRIVPIHPRILPLVIDMVTNANGIDNPDKYLIPAPHDFKQPYSKFRNDSLRELALAKIYTPHDMRHTFRTRLYKKGVDSFAIDVLMGHKTSNIGDRYTHLSLEDLRKEIEKLD